MNCHWQTVPHDWSGHRESSVTKFRPCTWNRVIGAGRRAEPIACRIIVAVGEYRIGQVVWAVMCVDCDLAEQVSCTVFLRVFGVLACCWMLCKQAVGRAVVKLWLQVRARYDDLPHAHVALAVQGPMSYGQESIAMTVAQMVIGSWSRTHGAGKNLAGWLAAGCSGVDYVHSFQAFYHKYSDTSLWCVSAVIICNI